MKKVIYCQPEIIMYILPVTDVLTASNFGLQTEYEGDLIGWPGMIG